MTQPEIRFKMPNWYYDKKALRKTPSFCDGISNSKEMRYRREGVRLIVKVGSKLGLKYETTASGTVYFHRFYMFHSFKQFPRFITSCCCLLLAGKVEETPKKCKQIIATAQEFLTDRQFQQFGDDPREEVMTLERILLKTIKFDLQVQHPYQFILRYAKGILGDREKIGKMVQMAWTFINDSFQTTLCLQWEPEIIAIAAIYLASKLGQFEISDWQGRTPNQRRWWEAFASEVSNDLLEDICHQILDLYQTTNPEQPQDSPAEEEVSPGTPKRHRPASPPPQPKTKQERKEDSHAIAQDNKKLQAPPMPPMVSTINSVAPPLPKEPPQFFAPPPTEPPPIPSHQGFQSMPPLPPIPPQPNAISNQPGLAAGQYAHPPPPLHPGINTQGPPVHARPVGSSSSVSTAYPPPGYYMPVPPPQDFTASSHQFYSNSTGAHHMGTSPHQVRQLPQAAGGPIRDHYRTSSQTHHPYMRGQSAYMMPPQRR